MADASSYIYKIQDNTTLRCYYGSTTIDPKLRFSLHRSAYKRYLDGKCGFNTAYEILSSNDYSFTVVESYEGLCKICLLMRERFYITNDKNAINKNRPYISDDERKALKKKAFLAFCSRNPDYFSERYRRTRKAKKENAEP